MTGPERGDLLQRMSLFLATNRHCLLCEAMSAFGSKRTWIKCLVMSASDPKRTLAFQRSELFRYDVLSSGHRGKIGLLRGAASGTG